MRKLVKQNCDTVRPCTGICDYEVSQATARAVFEGTKMIDRPDSYELLQRE